MDRLTPSCEMITQKVSKSMDEPLSFKEQLQVRFHLMMCEFCTRYRDQLLTIRKMIREQTEAWEPDSDVSEFSLSSEKREQIKKKLRENSPDS